MNELRSNARGGQFVIARDEWVTISLSTIPEKALELPCVHCLQSRCPFLIAGGAEEIAAWFVRQDCRAVLRGPKGRPLDLSSACSAASREFSVQTSARLLQWSLYPSDCQEPDTILSRPPGWRHLSLPTFVAQSLADVPAWS